MNQHFSAEIEITEDQDDGLRIGCSEKIVKLVVSYLGSQGFSCNKPNVTIPGTEHIHNYIEFTVNEQSFSNIRQSLINFLNSHHIKFTEDQLGSEDEDNSRFNLIDVSVFDK
jgi:hypothetical protein